MTQASDLPNRVARLENGEIEMRMAISALLSTVEIHQRDMEVFRANADRTNQNLDRTNRNIEGMLQIMSQSLQRMEVMEADIRGLQTENRRILDILQHRSNDDV